MKIKNPRTVEQLQETIRKNAERNLKIREQIASYKQKIKDIEAKIYESECNLKNVAGLNGHLSMAKRLNAEAIGSINKEGFDTVVVKVKGKWYSPTWKNIHSQPELVEVE